MLFPTVYGTTMRLFQFSNDSMIVSETALKSREADYTFNTLILEDYYDEYRILRVVVLSVSH